MPEPESPFLTTHEIAAFLGLSAERVRQLMAEGKLPSAKRGRLYLVPRAAWEEYVETLNAQARASMKVPPEQEAPHA